MSETNKQSKEELLKSIDGLIDEIFSEEKQIEKSIDIAQDAKTTADPVVNQAPKAQQDDARGAGRPKQQTDVPQTDMDGQRAKDYDGAISNDQSEEDQDEADQVKEMNQIKEGGRAKSSAEAPKMAPMKKSYELSEEEYEEFKALKKAKDEKEVEELKKAEEAKTEDLIKSVVAKTAERFEGKISSLEKSLSESQSLIKAMSEQPVRAKSITNISALEKSTSNSENPEPEAFSKSEMLDAAEELHKSGELTIDEVVELENNGYIFNEYSRSKLEKYLTKKG